MAAVFKHELRMYFHSLTAYVFGAFLLVIVGIGAMLYNLQAAVSNFEFVLSFSRALREELKERGIFVTAVCPGPVQTEFFDVAERYGSVLGIKKYVMAQPERVVRSALAASCKNRPMSVYGPAMNAFWLMTRLLPQDPVLHLTYRMKKKGECRCADPGKDCQTE